MKTAVGSIALCVFTLVFISSADVEYERAAACDNIDECVYKYSSTQYYFAEEDREKIKFSTDVHWRCESTGMFGSQSASEFCFTLSNGVVSSSSKVDIKSFVNYTTDKGKDAAIASFLSNELKGEFCYVQTSDGKIVSVHYGSMEGYDGINIKRSIASAFQANFNGSEDAKESDAGSIHTSHYRFDRKSGRVTMFTRTVSTNDLIQMASEVPDGSIMYIKQEESVFIYKILQRSRGKIRVKVDIGHQSVDDIAPEESDTYNPDLSFDKEFQSNGTYVIEKMYCNKRASRSVSFSNLNAPNLRKERHLLATIDKVAKEKYKIRKIREEIPSIPAFLGELHKNPSNINLVNRFQHLLELEAQYGPPPSYTPAIQQLIEYFKQIRASYKPDDVEIRTQIYGFLAADSSALSQKIMGSLLTESMTAEERNILLHQLTLVRNADPELVNTIININPSNNDGLLLILGALARDNKDDIQQTIVDVLLRRLNAIQTNGNSTEEVVTLNYALGNTGSYLALDALLECLNHDDIDVQISAVRSLDAHVCEPVTQNSLISLLLATTEDKILEEVVNLLTEAYDTQACKSFSDELLNATVEAAIKLENPHLYEFVIKYFKRLGTSEADTYIARIKKQYNYGDAQHEVVSDTLFDTRIKRGSDWDEQRSEYDVVAGYSQRRHDVLSYPFHKGYIWGKTSGISKIQLQMGAGAFIGGGCKGNKIFVKAAAKVKVWFKTFTVADFEYSDITTTNALFHKVYVKLGKKTYKDINEQYGAGTCDKSFRETSLWKTNRYPIFRFSFDVFIFVGTLGAEISGSVSSNANARLCVCPAYLRACADVVPAVTLRVEGSGRASLLYLVRGGITIAADFTYYLQPNLCAELLSGYTCDEGIKTCLSVHHGLADTYAEIYAWYQYRKLTWRGFKWSDKKIYDKLSDRKRIGSGSKSLLWSSCSTPITPCGY